MLQHTLNTAVAFLGSGSHGRGKVAMRLLPAAVDSGVHFVRKDVARNRSLVVAHWRNVVGTERCVVLGNDHGVTVESIGYLMSALKGCGIDNATIELDGPEVPALDGCIATFVRMIGYAGRAAQTGRRRAIRIERPVSVNHGPGFAVLTPADSPRYTLAWREPDPQGASRRLTFDLGRDCFRHELSWIRAPNSGASVVHAAENPLAAILTRPASAPREVDQWLRHAIVLSMGDLYLAGVPILGHYHGYDVCRWMNHRLLWQVFSNDASWSSVSVEGPHQVPRTRGRGRGGNG